MAGVIPTIQFYAHTTPPCREDTTRSGFFKTKQRSRKECDYISLRLRCLFTLQETHPLIFFSVSIY